MNTDTTDTESNIFRVNLIILNILAAIQIIILLHDQF
jgi:hypothetical protein